MKSRPKAGSADRLVSSAVATVTMPRKIATPPRPIQSRRRIDARRRDGKRMGLSVLMPPRSAGAGEAHRSNLLSDAPGQSLSVKQVVFARAAEIHDRLLPDTR